MLYLAEKLDEKEGDSRAPSGGCVRRNVVIVGGIRRDDSSMSTGLVL